MNKIIASFMVACVLGFTGTALAHNNQGPKDESNPHCVVENEHGKHTHCYQTPTPSPSPSPSVSVSPSVTPSVTPTPSVSPSSTPKVTTQTTTSLPDVGGHGTAKPF